MKHEMIMKAAVAAAALSTLVASANSAVLWDTGAPHQGIVGGFVNWIGWASGYASSNSPQRWSAIPFRVGEQGWHVNQVDVDYWIPGGSTASNVTYIVWERTNLQTPTVMAMTGTLGRARAGIDDPRTANEDDWLHQYAADIALDPGDYYFTIHGGTEPGELISWWTGGDLQDETLEQDFMWRSANFPAPGFAPYTSGSILPGPNMPDGQDLWNACFAFHGEPVPEPSTIVAVCAGLALFVRRARK